MATATALPDTKELERELQQELQRFEAVQKKIDADQEKLQAANAEKARLTAAVGYGTAQPADVVRVEEQIHAITIRLEGSAPILQKHRARIDELQTEIRRRQVEANKAAHEKEYLELKARAANRAALIRDVLTELCTEAFPEFEQERQRLALEFRDLGGVDDAVALGQLLFNPSKGSEALRNPEVHFAQLEARGYIGLGPLVHPFGSTKDIWKPGLDPLRLTVYGVRPKT